MEGRWQNVAGRLRKEVKVTAKLVHCLLYSDCKIIKTLNLTYSTDVLSKFSVFSQCYTYIISH